MERAYPSTRSRRRPTRRSKRQAHYSSSTSGQEPLLLLDANVPIVAGRPVISPRGHVELSSDFSSYQPPQLAQNPYGDERRAEDNTEDCLPPVWFVASPSHRPPVNRNPAPDLALSLCSHGCCCIQCVRTQEIGFTEECGRFEQMLSPGVYCLAWPYQAIVGRLSLRIKQLDVTCETKTKDHVFVHLTVSLLYRVASIHSYEAFYSLSNPAEIIRTSVFDVVRSTIPKRMTLDDVFAETNSIAAAVYVHLQETMHEYGYDIVTSLVTEIRPNERVKASMNEIGASRRRKLAAAHQAEAAKVKVVREAEAAAESHGIRGVGIARQRRAIAEGMKVSVQTWTEMDVRIISPPKPAEVMELLLVSQYLDVLTSVGATSLQIQHEVSANGLRSMLR